MKNISDILSELQTGEFAAMIQYESELSAMEVAVRQILVDVDFGDIGCRAAVYSKGELQLRANAAAIVRLRQMKAMLLQRLQRQFPQIKHLNFGIQY